MLKRQDGFLHADCREQDDVCNAGLSCRFEYLDMRAMINGPCIRRRPGSGGHARHDRVKALAPEAIAHE